VNAPAMQNKENVSSYSKTVQTKITNLYTTLKTQNQNQWIDQRSTRI